MSADPLTALLDLIVPAPIPRDPAAPDTSRPMTAVEQAQYDAGKLLEAQGEWLVAQGEAMQYAAEAAADPEFYTALAERSAQDAANAEARYVAACAAARKQAIGNPPRSTTGD